MKETDTFPTDMILTAAVFVQTQMQIEEKHSLIAPSNLRLKDQVYPLESFRMSVQWPGLWTLYLFMVN